MKIIYLHQYFKTPAEGGAIRSYYLTKALVKAGYQVELITSHNKKGSQIIDIEGVTVHYLPIYYENQFGFLARIGAFLKFFWQSYRVARQIKNVDLVYATSTPLTVGITALLLKKIHKIPYFFEVRDLWPQAPIELGFIRNFFLKKILLFLEQKIYQNAEKIIALSPAMQTHIQRKSKQKSVFLIPNIADTDFFVPETKNSSVLKKYSLDNQLVITYFGTVGLANHLEYLLEIARYSQHQKNENVQFLIVGEGARLLKIKELAKEYKLDNLRFLPNCNKAELKEILNITDVVYVSFWQKSILETTSPNKFFDALASGKLCTVNVQGWLKDLVEQNECGFYANPTQAEEFYTKLLPFLNDKDLLQNYQKNARQLAESQFSILLASQNFLELFVNKKNSL